LALDAPAEDVLDGAGLTGSDYLADYLERVFLESSFFKPDVGLAAGASAGFLRSSAGTLLEVAACAPLATSFSFFSSEAVLLFCFSSSAFFFSASRAASLLASSRFVSTLADALY